MEHSIDAAAAEIETWHIDQLIPYDRNPRKITPAAVQKVARSITKFGFNSPIIVDEEGVILAGHTRREALISLGATQVAVIVKHDLNEQQKRAYRIMDNRAGEEAEWDGDLLKIELLELGELGDFDVADLGFDSDELNRYLSDTPDEPAANGVPAKAAPVAKGQLADRFGVPPFSVLNAREGWWQDRSGNGWGLVSVRKLAAATRRSEAPRCPSIAPAPRLTRTGLLFSIPCSANWHIDGSARRAAL
jgi:ParB-like chromosome segregation protein Spo0J